ncbi:hypothetical protein HanRHA438_Chr15g0724091 [Helianthus annuus]|nr:hypothetical protein HanIR_Chr15g0774611 [Helianthus annuus]KAJ0846374.1 hypothetical protein HanRHA438_Chr15g0724091 [Helianthus annuus]
MGLDFDWNFCYSLRINPQSVIRFPWAFSGNVTFDLAIVASSGLITPIPAVNSNVSLITALVTHSVIVPYTTFTPNAQIIALSGLVIFLPHVYWIWLLSTVVQHAPLISNNF